jgi:hypothetical protein
VPACRLSGHNDITRRWFKKICYQPEERRLAAARRTDERDELSLFDGKRHIDKGVDLVGLALVEDLVQIADVDC